VMLPPAYQLPAAIALVLTGALTCLAGYRLFRIILGIYGFIGGALVASTVVGSSSAVNMVLAALFGGIAGAVILVLAYFVGVALVGAGLGAFLTQFVWHQVLSGDPPAAAIVAMAIVGAVSAMWLQRYVIIVATAFGGAWTAIVGALAIAGGPASTADGAAWVLYPLTPDAPRMPVVIGWLVLGFAGTALQLGWSGKKKK
jgi:hypothetical protein